MPNKCQKIYKKLIKLPWNEKMMILRTMDKLSQKEVADKLNTTQKMYWNWEKGIYQPNKYNRKSIARIYNVGVEEIFSK